MAFKRSICVLAAEGTPPPAERCDVCARGCDSSSLFSKMFTDTDWFVPVLTGIHRHRMGTPVPTGGVVPL